MAYITFDGNGYAYTAIAQLVLAVYAAAHLALVRNKSNAARWLLYFFLCFAASSVVYFLINALTDWGVLLAPLQDALILLSGVCLVRFACAFPVEQPGRWQWLPLSFLIVLTALALALSLAWIIYGIVVPNPWRTISEAYYFLLPLGILTSIGVFLVRAVQVDERPAPPGASISGRGRRAAAILLRPHGRYAQAHLLFAVSVLLGALPAVAALDAVGRTLGAPLTALLIGPGSILAVAAIFFAYLHYAPEWSSFSVRLISIALVTLLVVLNAVGVFLIIQVSQRVRTEAQLLAFTTGALDLANLPAAAPAALAYVIDWGAAADAAPPAQLLYRRSDLGAELPADLLPAARTDSGQSIVFRNAAVHQAAIQAADSTAMAANWTPQPSAARYGATWIDRLVDPSRGPPKRFMGFPVIQQNRWYEVGIDVDVINQRLYTLTALLILATFVGLVLTLTGHVLLIRPTLIRPLQRLLTGVRRATSGDLTATLPVVYRDEVGVLTESFNSMTAELRDLTEGLEQKVAARTAELKAAKDHAEQASRAKSAFLANVSHELRTPLTAMLGYAELVLKRHSLGADMRVEITTIYESGQQLLVLINDMLDMTRIEADVMVFHQRRVNLRHLIDQVLLTHRLAAEAKHLTLQIEFAAMTPTVVETDVDKVKRILMNLIGNAIKFTETGGVTLSVACCPITHVGADTECVDGARQAADAPTQRLLVTEVRDTGMGIPPALHEQIFAEFTQIKATTPQAAQGLGLGLSISRRLARLMGGDLTVTSSGVPGAGACFRLSVPVICLTSASPAPAPTAIAPATPAPSAMTGVAMLVAEDIDANRALLAHHLRAAGCTVYEARNGQEALDKWLQVHPAVLWLDMRMPVVSGQEVVRQVRAHPSGAATRIVAVTASAFEEDRAALLALGCDEFLRKPYQRQDVIDLVARISTGAASSQSAGAAAVTPSAGAAPAQEAAPHVWLHQLRNAIGANGGLAEILHDDADRITGEEAKRCLAEIEASTHRIGATLVDLGHWIDEVAPVPRRRSR